jgi:thiamine pyrophosphate-dependent acetolactate synthase large subunit-like protein
MVKDSNRNFYMLGSMGLASSIALGLASNLPNRRIIVIEGDANILMNMGSIATIGHYSPSNLIHIVLDNEVYESCGGQPSASKTIELDKVALAAHYNLVLRAISERQLRSSIAKSLFNGPTFILVKVERGRMLEKLTSVPFMPNEIGRRFKDFIASS